eukprot:gene40158-49666_t
MFNLTPTETFKAPVKVQVATKSGIWREESFSGIFLRTGEEDRERLLALKNVELLREVLQGWEMVDEERKPVPFTEDNFEAFLKLTGAVREATVAYWNHNAARWWAGVREDTAPDFTQPQAKANSANASAGLRNLHQLIQLRWIAVVGQLLTIEATFYSLGLPLPVQAMLSIVAGMVVFNVLSLLRWRTRRSVHDVELFIALLVDVGALDDTHFAFGSRDRGVTILNAAGEVAKQIEADLLGSLIVNALVLDRDGALWVALENGLAVVAPAREAAQPKVAPLDGAGARSPWASGLPIMRSFPETPGGSRASAAAILVSRDGLVYIGNAGGLFEFDGVRWRNIPLPELSVIYSLVSDAAGRVWYGGDNCFGVLVPDVTG